MPETNDFTITKKTQDKIPPVPFVNIKNACLGKNYSLSLVFIGQKKSKKLNYIYRGKDKPTNILSFPLDKKNGEIFMTLKVIRKEAGLFDKTFTNFVAFLFIHGLLHLNGYEHGSRMERAEKKLVKKFKFD